MWIATIHPVELDTINEQNNSLGLIPKSLSLLLNPNGLESVECENPCLARVLIENWEGNKLNLCFRDAENESFAGRVRH